MKHKITMTDSSGKKWVVEAPPDLIEDELKPIETSKDRLVNWGNFQNGDFYWNDAGEPYRVTVNDFEVALKQV